MIKKYNLYCTIYETIQEQQEENGRYCLSKDLQKLWDFCEKEIKRQEPYTVYDYNNGSIDTYRKIQQEINGTCTQFKDKGK